MPGAFALALEYRVMDESPRIALRLERLPRTVALAAVGDEAACARLAPAGREALGRWAAEAGAPKGAPVLVLLDQTQLPGREAYACTADWRRVVRAIQALEVRGAPAIGVAGAAAVALAAFELAGEALAGLDGRGAPEGAGDAVPDAAAFLAELGEAAAAIGAARPTAVNLEAAVGRAWASARALAATGGRPAAIAAALAALARAMEAEDEAANRAIGANGASLLAPGSRVLTHCNAGSLATAFYGTALGVVYAAAEQGRVARVYADETRPVGQGARLTAWELSRAGVPVTLLCDSMAASAMAQGLVDAVVVGADRIAANGDVANKVGTYGVAVLARHHGIPLYVAAPSTTIDLACPDGSAIPIEQRAAAEVLPEPIDGVEVWNPAFDVTPAALVTAIVTEGGAFAPGAIADAVAVTAPGGPRPVPSPSTSPEPIERS